MVSSSGLSYELPAETTIGGTFAETASSITLFVDANFFIERFSGSRISPGSAAKDVKLPSGQSGGKTAVESVARRLYAAVGDDKLLENAGTLDVRTTPVSSVVVVFFKLSTVAFSRLVLRSESDDKVDTFILAELGSIDGLLIRGAHAETVRNDEDVIVEGLGECFLALLVVE